VWREERANPRAWAYGFAAAVVPFVLLMGIGSLIARLPPSPYVFGLFLGRYLAAGVITGAIAHASRSRWRPWVYVLVAVAGYVAVGVLSTMGHQPTT
jgi:chromate transport protein ChrA